MSDVRIAIIGGGVIGSRHGDAIADAKGAVMVAVADPAPTGKELAGDLQVPLYGDIESISADVSHQVREWEKEAALDFPNLTLWHHGENTPDWNHAIEPDAMSGALENAYIHQIEHFVEVIRGEAEPLISGADAVETLRATLAVYDAAKSGQRQML